MEPKEEAKELVDKLRFYQPSAVDGCDQESRQYRAKQCALICVEEILKNPLASYPKSLGTPIGSKNYWQEVEQEIHKL